MNLLEMFELIEANYKELGEYSERNGFGFKSDSILETDGILNDSNAWERIKRALSTHPELREALKGMVEAYRHDYGNNNDAWRIANEAVKKAEGSL